MIHPSKFHLGHGRRKEGRTHKTPTRVPSRSSNPHEPPSPKTFNRGGKRTGHLPPPIYSPTRQPTTTTRRPKEGKKKERQERRRTEKSAFENRLFLRPREGDRNCAGEFESLTDAVPNLHPDPPPSQGTLTPSHPHLHHSPRSFPVFVPPFLNLRHFCNLVNTSFSLLSFLTASFHCFFSTAAFHCFFPTATFHFFFSSPRLSTAFFSTATFHCFFPTAFFHCFSPAFFHCFSLAVFLLVWVLF